MKTSCVFLSLSEQRLLHVKLKSSLAVRGQVQISKPKKWYWELSSWNSICIFKNYVYQHVCISAYIAYLWLWLFTGKKPWLKQRKCKIQKEIFGNWRAGRQENEGTIAKTTCSARSPKDKYLIIMSNNEIDNEVIFCFVSIFFKMQEAVIFFP